MAKVKGLLKGLRYISQIFDEQKEQEMQIGLPTDVKHVAHIGWDGPSADNPSWMKDFKTPEGGPQSATLSVGETKEIPNDKMVSQDSKLRDHPDVPKAGRRLSGRKKSSSSSSGTNSPKNEKSKHPSRRHRLKDSESSSLHRVGSGSTGSDESPRDLEEIPKKTRRKKSSKSSRNSSRSSSGSGFLTCGSEPEFSINSSKSIKEVK